MIVSFLKGKLRLGLGKNLILLKIQRQVHLQPSTIPDHYSRRVKTGAEPLEKLDKSLQISLI